MNTKRIHKIVVKSTATFTALALLSSNVGLAYAATADESLGLTNMSRKNTQRIAVQQAVIVLGSEAKDLDGDGYFETPVMRTMSGAPVGGGGIPLSSAAPKNDSYGTDLGYCSFDNGSVNSSTGRISGSTSGYVAPVLAVISAGNDNLFQTSCADVSAGSGPKGDDYLISYNSTQIQMGNSGTLYYGDPVQDLAALNALDPSSLTDGQIRILRSTGAMYRWDAAVPAWAPVSSSNVQLNAITAATAANAINNGVNAQQWAWQLTSDVAGLELGESGASTGGASAQSILKISTLAGSTATPLSVSSRGIETLRVDPGNPQVLVAPGTIAAPGLSFIGNKTTGFSLPTTSLLVASIGGVRKLSIDGANNNFSALGALNPATTGARNIAIGTSTYGGNMFSNTTGSDNIAFGNDALRSNTTGSNNIIFGSGAGYSLQTHNSNVLIGGGSGVYLSGNGNVGIGSESLRDSAGDNNIGLGTRALAYARGGHNIGIGHHAMNYNITGMFNIGLGDGTGGATTATRSTYIGHQAKSVGDLGYVTLLGAHASASLGGTANSASYMTAIGAGAVVNSVNTVVLGRPGDRTVIGATADSGSAALLQITGASQHVPLSVVPTGVAGMLYFDDPSKQFKYHDGSSWKNASSPALSQITAATTTNTINNGGFSQQWNWSLNNDTVGFKLGESAASTGGTNAQILVSIGTIAGSTATPLVVYSGGNEVFRVNNSDQQVLFAAGTKVAPSISFSGAPGTGFFFPAPGKLGASINGNSVMLIDSDVNNSATALGFNALSQALGFSNTAVGYRALEINNGDSNTAIGSRTLSNNLYGYENTAVGSNALELNTEGNFNVAIGNSSLSKNTTGSSNTAIGSYSLVNNDTGSRNTAIGVSSLAENITGEYNTAIGDSSMYANTTGMYNVAVGSSSLRNSTTGWFNTSVGSESMVSNTSGGSNTAFGYTALNRNTEGGYNAAFGVSALVNNMTGGSNSAFGTLSLRDNTTGSHNVAFGYRALEGNVSGVANTAIGPESLTSNTSGTNNVAVGNGTLADATTGFENTAVGPNALGGGIVTGSGNIGFGSYTGYNLAGGSYNVIIGNQSGNTIKNTNNSVIIGPSANTSHDIGSATLLGWMARATLTADTTNSYMSAIGAGSLVTTTNTVVLGRASDTTVIGATGKNVSPNKLQVTGGIEAVSGNVTVSTAAGQFLGSTGTVSVPSFAFVGRTNTGFYSPAAGQIAATIAGARSFFVNNSTTANLVAIGSGALASNTATGHNIGIGLDALRNNTRNFNIAIGVDSLRNNTGWNNVGIGHSTLVSNTGYSNTAIGWQAMKVNAGGDANTAIGSDSLSSITEGGSNTAVGSSSGLALTTGYSNTFFGSDTANLLATGHQNSAIGNESLKDLVGGHSNVSLGYRSGFGVVNNSGNTTIGEQSGMQNDLGFVTLVGSNATANLGVADSNAFMTAIGAYSEVTTKNTIVLGTIYDTTVIGATGTNGSAAILQINGASQHVGLSAAPSGSGATAGGMMYFNSTSKEMMVYNGTAWESVNRPSLSQLADATASNIINNAAHSQSWNWSLTGNTTAFEIGESIASTGGSASGTQYLLKIGTKLGSTAVPLSVSSRGTEIFRVSHNSHQILMHRGTSTRPILSFMSEPGTGLYSEGIGEIGLSASETPVLRLSTSNVMIGADAMRGDGHTPLTGEQNVAIGTNALWGNRTGSQNIAIGTESQNFSTGEYNISMGYNSLVTASGSGNIAIGAYAMSTVTNSSGNVVIGNDSSQLLEQGDYNVIIGATTGLEQSPNIGRATLIGAGSSVALSDDTNFSYATAIGAGSRVASINTIVLGRPIDNISIGQDIAGPQQFFVNGTAGGTSAYAVSSDIRFKMNITPLASAMKIISALQGVSYEFNSAAFPNRKFEIGRQHGFIAQQIEQFVPEVVRTDKDGYKSVQYSQLVPLLAEGLKEHHGILQHFSKKDDVTLMIDIPTIEGNEARLNRLAAEEIKVKRLEAEYAKLAKLEAEEIDANKIQAKSVRSDIVKTGEVNVYIGAGAFQPMFTPIAGGQFIVNATAEDGSVALASVSMSGSTVIVTPITPVNGIEILAIGSQVGVTAANKKVKATWIRMG